MWTYFCHRINDAANVKHKDNTLYLSFAFFLRSIIFLILFQILLGNILKAKYLCGEVIHQTTNIMDLTKSLPSQLPRLRFLDQFMAHHPGYVAGGCFKNLFLGEKIKDVDIFFEDISGFQAAVKIFEENDLYKKAYENDRVTAFRQGGTGIVVELIGSFFNEPGLMIEDFDFSITKAFYCKNDETGEYEFYHHPRFFEHLMNKKLVLDDKILFPLSTFNRSYRYTRYGFGLCGESKEKLILSLQGFNGVVTSDFYFGID